MIQIKNASIVLPSGIYANQTIELVGSKITKIYMGRPEVRPNDKVIDAAGSYVCAGFIDLHLHGGGGYTFMDADIDGIRAACRAHLQCGTTTILPTSFAAPISVTKKMIQNVKEAARSVSCTVPGVHLEGPFLSPMQCGAQVGTNMLLPTPENWRPLLKAWQGGIKMMGVAPELQGAMELGRELRRRGIVASIAHSDADYDTCISAKQNGYSDITHLYSGCSIVHRKNAYRHGGVVEAGLLEDDFTVQVIADGKHLPVELLRLIYKCKGASNMYLVSDALFPAGLELPEGIRYPKTTYSPNMVLEDGVMKLENRQAFAGSIATMNQLVRNMVFEVGVPVTDAITMATLTPARRIGLDTNKGLIQPGYDADVLILDKKLQVKTVIAKGTIIRE